MLTSTRTTAPGMGRPTRSVSMRAAPGDVAPLPRGILLMKPQDRTRSILTSTLPQAQKLILVAIADHFGADGYGYPGIPRLSAMASMSSRRVKEHIKKLDDLGILQRQFRPGTQPPLYGIDFAAVRSYQGRIVTGDKTSPPTRDKTSPVPGTIRPPEAVREATKGSTPKPPKGARRKRGPRRRDLSPQPPAKAPPHTLLPEHATYCWCKDNGEPPTHASEQDLTAAADHARRYHLPVPTCLQHFANVVPFRATQQEEA